MSPEQARGKSVDRRTDIWAYGCCLYEALTGKAVFPGETVSDTIAKILEREPDFRALPEPSPRWLHRLLRRWLDERSGPPVARHRRRKARDRRRTEHPFGRRVWRRGSGESTGAECSSLGRVRGRRGPGRADPLGPLARHSGDTRARGAREPDPRAATRGVSSRSDPASDTRHLAVRQMARVRHPRQ